ncbi:MAG: winged helix-turn-helix domain-containing protein, partial [Clostridiales bacterium]|nr:winged helix-turn-helix domain-containing protein [Clostridiales bacterium]
LGQLEFYIRERDYKRMEEEIISCFARWEEKGYTQLSTEEKVREIFRLFRRENLLDEPVENSEYFIDDAFYYAESMNKLAELLGIGRASLYRAMETLEKKGIVAREGKCIAILKPNDLLHYDGAQGIREDETT